MTPLTDAEVDHLAQVAQEAITLVNQAASARDEQPVSSRLVWGSRSVRHLLGVDRCGHGCPAGVHCNHAGQGGEPLLLDATGTGKAFKVG
jgi:hypothetical protein